LQGMKINLVCKGHWLKIMWNKFCADHTFCVRPLNSVS
jgi:hypothetical protein